MSGEFEVSGISDEALFTLKLHRGEGMCLVAMNWKEGTPPKDFVGFAIEYKEPDGIKFFALKNRLCFPGSEGEVKPNRLSTRLRRSRNSAGFISRETRSFPESSSTRSLQCS